MFGHQSTMHFLALGFVQVAPHPWTSSIHSPFPQLIPTQLQCRLLLLESLLRHSVSLREAPSRVLRQPNTAVTTLHGILTRFPLCLFCTPLTPQRQGPIPISFSRGFRNVLEWLWRPEMAQLRVVSTSRMPLETLEENFQKMTQVRS